MKLGCGDFLAGPHDPLTVAELVCALAGNVLPVMGWLDDRRQESPSFADIESRIKSVITQIHHDIDEDENDTVERDQILHH